ncbi:tetratricopeptide repeat protein [candidate division KSB1 bacterium]|nr:tetratricopeptide repeat protein [candidate division KSB1 bacterium]
MQRIHSILLVSALLVVLLMMFGCQSKELTSAKVYIQQDDWTKAEEQLKQAVATYPNEAEAHLLLAEAYARRGNYVDMSKELATTLEVSPQLEEKVKVLKDKYWVQEFNNGVNKVKASESATDDETRNKIMLEALASFKDCPIIDPTRVDAHKNIAFVYIRMDSLAAAAKVYRQILEIDPKDTEVMLRAGSIYYDEKKYDECIDMMNKILAIEPDNIEAISQKAFSYDSMGKTDEAFATYNDVLEKQPNNPDIIFNLGRLLFLQKKYEDAIKEFKRVLDIEPDDYDATLNIGNAYLSLAEQKMKPLREGAQMKKSESEAMLAEAVEEYKNAIPFLEKAVSIKNDPSIWSNLGVAYINAGMKEKGEEAFKKADGN